MTRADVLALLEANRDVIRAFGVRSLALFGSFARDEATESSDVDLLVDFERKSFDAYMDLKAFLERLFGRKVDLVLPSTLKPLLKAPILASAVHAAVL